MLKLSGRRSRAAVRLASDRPLSLVGPRSFLLDTRPEDDGAMWPALAARCRRALPAKLHWAAPLLDAQQPLPVLCAEAQVRELFHWLERLPNTERVSIACRRQPDGTCNPQRPSGAALARSTSTAAPSNRNHTQQRKGGLAWVHR
jgi:hypothetical protein